MLEERRASEPWQEERIAREVLEIRCLGHQQWQSGQPAVVTQTSAVQRGDGVSNEPPLQ